MAEFSLLQISKPNIKQNRKSVEERDAFNDAVVFQNIKLYTAIAAATATNKYKAYLFLATISCLQKELKACLNNK